MSPNALVKLLGEGLSIDSIELLHINLLVEACDLGCDLLAALRRLQSGLDMHQSGVAARQSTALAKEVGLDAVDSIRLAGDEGDDIGVSLGRRGVGDDRHLDERRRFVYWEVVGSLW